MAKSFGQLHRLVDRDAGRHVVPVKHLRHGKAHDIAIHGRQALQRPFLSSALNHLVDFPQVLHSHLGKPDRRLFQTGIRAVAGRGLSEGSRDIRHRQLAYIHLKEEPEGQFPDLPPSICRHPLTSPFVVG